MSDYLPTIGSIPSNGGPGSIALSEPTSNRRQRDSPIYTLNGDVLLNIFHLYRLAEYDDETEIATAWSRQRWWYKLAQVCRQWRNIILESPSRLDLHLFCTNGVPVADMLAYSPPLPLTIYYTAANWKITVEDESGIFLALLHRDRVHHIDLRMQNVEEFVTVMDDQFPILERMYIGSSIEVVLPVTFQAPNLRQLKLWTVSLPIGSPLLTTSTAGLVILELHDIPASAYFPPSYILTQLPLMTELERLSIEFKSPILNPAFHQTPDITTLPNLRWFVFQGVSTYLEDLVAQISAPSLSSLRVCLFDQPPFTVPPLFQFMQTSENLTFSAVQVNFGALSVSLHADPWKWDTPLMLKIMCRNLDGQLASAVQLFGTLSPLLSVVEQVTVSYKEHFLSLIWHNNDSVDRTQWRELLRPFTNAKTIHVHHNLVHKIFRSLSSGDGEPPLELLPNLEQIGYSANEIGYSGGSDALDACTKFLNERQVAGHPVSLRLVDHSMFDTPRDEWV